MSANPFAPMRWLLLGSILSAGFLSVLSQSQGHADEVSPGKVARAPFAVKIQDDKPVVVEADLPVDPVQRIRFSGQQNLFLNIANEQGQQLHLSHFPSLSVDGQLVNPQNGQGRSEMTNVKLPTSPGGKPRTGFMNVWSNGDLRVVQTVELVPTKSPTPGAKRRLDSVLVRYSLENKGKQDHKVGLRLYMDTYVIDNDGCMFAAPTLPNKILDGLELKGKTLPDFVQLLQRPDLKNPGFVAHLTLNLGSAMERPNRVVLTRHGLGFNTWEMQAAQSMGDSALGVFWEPREVKAGAKREIAYAYGQGIAVAPENEGRFQVVLGGNFEPGKLFTISAYVADPATGQTLTLELPKGMQRIEGKEIQPVPPATEDSPQSMVLWKARVLEPGQFPLRIRSSTGMTQTKMITISRTEGGQ